RPFSSRGPSSAGLRAPLLRKGPLGAAQKSLGSFTELGARELREEPFFSELLGADPWIRGPRQGAEKLGNPLPGHVPLAAFLSLIRHMVKPRGATFANHGPQRVSRKSLGPSFPFVASTTERLRIFR